MLYRRTRLLTIASLLAGMLVLSGASMASVDGSAPLPAGEQPVLITPAGQGPGGAIVSVLCKRNRVEAQELPMATAEHVKSFKTVIVVIGSSLKGLGAAGISIDQEIARVRSIIEEAKKRDMLVIGVHIEGEARRGGNCEKVIDDIAHRVDYLIVRSDGNKDGRFDRIAEEKKVPMRIINETAEFMDLLRGIFH
jgi:hypothetical protein